MHLYPSVTFLDLVGLQENPEANILDFEEPKDNALMSASSDSPTLKHRK